jgi:exodeoxyribonuclease V alpha subunit
MIVSMNVDFSFSSFVRDLFPEAGAELLRLHELAAENSNLLRVDFYTIHDLVELSGYAGEEALQALLLIMLVALDEGSLCIDASEPSLKRRLEDLAGDTAARTWSERITSRLRECGFPALIGAGVDEGKPVVLRRAGSRTYLYFQKYLKHELILQSELRRRLGLEKLPAPGDSRSLEMKLKPLSGPPLAKALHEVLIDFPPLVSGRPLRLNRDQRLAIGLTLLRDFVIVSGGPGTGKTSIVFTLLRCLVRAGISAERIALAGPTGRAAQRLTDAIRLGLENLEKPAGGESPDSALKNVGAKTLHQLLGYNPSRDTYRHHAENPLPYDVVIVDEVSMVGLVLMARLFQAVEPGTKLILLGDKDQLPSVDAGAVLATLAPAARTPSFSASIAAQIGQLWSDVSVPAAGKSDPLEDVLVVLQENYRSERSIHEVATAVNAQQLEALDKIPTFIIPRPEDRRPEVDGFADLQGRGGCRLIEQGQGDVAQWHHVLDQWARHQYLAGPPDNYCALVDQCGNFSADEPSPDQRNALDTLFLLLARSRVLSLVREGPWGCVGVNAYLERVLRPRLDRASRGRIFAGLPVLITRNDQSRLLFNGDVGIALRSPAGYRVVFQRTDGYSAFPAELLPPHEPAFALTVHKSQGSEYDQVLLVLPPEGGRRLLTKEMIYTGITRARQLAIICAKREVLRLAVGRKIERESALLALD